MARPSPIDEPRISGLDSKTVAEIVDLVRTEVRAEIAASRTKAGETHPRPQGAVHHPAIATSRQVWAAAGTTIAAVALIAGFFLWQLADFRDEMRANFQSIRAEIGSVREEVAAIRGEVAALGEQVARIKTLLADRLPAAP